MFFKLSDEMVHFVIAKHHSNLLNRIIGGGQQNLGLTDPAVNDVVDAGDSKGTLV